MNCAHCGYACGPNGDNMSFETFKIILDKWGDKIAKHHSCIILGGGEPTLHPEFWKFVEHASMYALPWIATNGAKTSDAISLARLAKQNKVIATLSLDQWHDPIEQCVIDEFKNGLTKHRGKWEEWSSNTKGDNRLIRTVINPRKSGRCKEGENECCCRTVTIEPKGNIRFCGCLDAPIIGAVKKGFISKYIGLPWSGLCFKDQLL